jgi:hypothetical protein
MRILGIMAIGLALLGCGGDAESTDSTSSVPEAAATTVATTETTVADTATEGGEFCATGVYLLDGKQFWANAAAASTDPGTGEVISGQVVLELGQDFSAVLRMEEWTVLLSFPGEEDKVQMVQTGEVTGTWDNDPDERHWITFTSDTVSGQFTLLTARGPVPVPNGGKLAPLGRVDIIFDCLGTDMSLLADDADLGVTLEWPFVRQM